MFAQDAFVQVRLKERKSYAKDKAVRMNSLFFMLKAIKRAETELFRSALYLCLILF